MSISSLPRRRSSSTLTVRAREAKAHALIVALVGWSFAVASGVVGPGNRSILGQIKWTDFAHFYTFGHIARTGPVSALYDDRASFARQLQLVPGSETERYIAVYGPQVALLFAPFSWMPYILAGAAWAGFSVWTYLLCVRSAWKPAREAIDDYRFVLVAALAFPPAWQLAAYGQTTAIPLIAFTAGWLALERGRPFVAGLLLGLLTVKPQLGLVLAPVALVTAEWMVVAGVVASVFVQALVVFAWFGAAIFVDYWHALARIPQAAHFLEPDFYKLHSIAALTERLPASVGLLLWATASVFIIAAVVLVWRSTPAWRVRFGVLVLASVLVSPHVVVYDLAVLTPAMLWLGGWMQETGLETGWFWQRLYWLAAATLVPTAAFLWLQASVVILIELFVRVVVEVVVYARMARTLAASGSSRDLARPSAMSW
jgi:alpha-1,2-mannosyltransferase